ncbi:MAG TPA: DUF1080 domain-containing protein, partial [Armatimonadetes bacterium]|nr:DUF1080 domain-containing protein [Armatimonadota bacterium]
MQREWLTVALSVVVATAIACAQREQQPINQLTVEEKADGFVLLFNGRDLSNWVVMGKRDGWTVKDGV